MRVRDWRRFQNHKDRKPIWIKLYREEILDRLDIHMLSDNAFRILINLFLIASEDKELDGNLPELDEIAFRLRRDKDKVVSALGELGPFLDQICTNLVPEPDQLDTSEKRREETEESREDEANASYAEPEADSAQLPVLEFPIVGSDELWKLTESKFAEYEESFPHLDVLHVLKAARQWCRDNPQNRKTSRGMTRFLGSWLNREQNRGGRADSKPTAKKNADGKEVDRFGYTRADRGLE